MEWVATRDIDSRAGGMVRRVLRDTIARMTSDKVVYIEGGLGSQILGMIVYMLRRQEDVRVCADVSYFFPPRSNPVDSGTVTLWPWELSRYGFSLHDVDFLSNRRRRLRPTYDLQAEIGGRYLRKASTHDLVKSFPPVPETTPLLTELGLLGRPYAAVHVRRGDYLRASSRIVTITESLRLLAHMGPLLPRDLVLVCDESFSESDHELIEKHMGDVSVHHLEGGDPHIAHGVLRRASLLVTSNSTFSFSAALLRSHQDGLVFSPAHFFSPSPSPVNSFYQAPAEWMILRNMTDSDRDR